MKHLCPVDTVRDVRRSHERTANIAGFRQTPLRDAAVSPPPPCRAHSHTSRGHLDHLWFLHSLTPLFQSETSSSCFPHDGSASCLPSFSSCQFKADSFRWQLGPPLIFFSDFLVV